MQRDVYVSARIGMIGFKGLNLTWRLNYKRLHFQSFEIRSPEVQVNSSSSPDRRVKIEHPASKTLYEVISPYIDVLSVKTLNLENATVSYRVRNVIANLALRNDNPSHPEKSDSKLRYINMYVERDPYHSTFNYLWQMLRPAVAASVGAPKKEQDTIQHISTFFQKVKRFFEGEKHKREEAAKMF